MTFDQWWSALTDKEQKEIGLHNAKFVWNGAMEVGAKVCDVIDNGREDLSFECAAGIRNLKAQTQLFDDWDVKWTKSNT